MCCTCGLAGDRALESEESPDDQLHIGPGIPPTQLRAAIGRAAFRLVEPYQRADQQVVVDLEAVLSGLPGEQQMMVRRWLLEQGLA